ncbi:Mobile element protein [Methanosarcina barkeri str. Wiesmoor]|uniref:Mobile element protein n=2 Tax=Methanosarcina barkeri TaxID=2208 RepID=A0A0E3QN58_METBA|nr:IS4-like element ISMba6 family transposase [Methanosarcina barkeri]AKB51790.1 Mobile element protein [Methanosarcina barkeri str. Wiesmoor]
MSPCPPPTLEDSLREMFPEEWLRQTAKETGLIVRERKIDPVIIFWVLTLSFGVRLQRTLASLKREYETESQKTISDSSWYYRFTPELVEFLHQCVIHGMEELAKEPGRKLSKKLETFQDVVIQDSTIVRLHSSLADKFPAARSRTVAAGVKVGVMVSAIANGPRTIALYSEKTAEIKTLKIGPWIKDHILLVDLGFYKTQMFARVEENGGYFVSRIRKNMDPILVSIEEGLSKTKSKEFAGKPVSECIKQLSGKDIDAVVKIEFKRREYKGKQKQDEMIVRLVAVYNDEDEKYHIYITNIQKDILNAKDIANLYGARWDIELLFKELKSKYSLDVLETKNVQVIEALIWTAILTLIVSRRIYSLVRKSTTHPEKMARYTQLRWSTIFAENASDLLTVILHRCGIQRTFETIMSVYESQALDPHVNRERFRDEWFE